MQFLMLKGKIGGLVGEICAIFDTGESRKKVRGICAIFEIYLETCTAQMMLVMLT